MALRLKMRSDAEIDEPQQVGLLPHGAGGLEITEDDWLRLLGQ